MSEDGIILEGQEAVDNLLSNFTPQNFLRNVIIPAAEKIGLQIQSRLERTPGPSSQPVKWASRASRAWYHAMRRKDGLPAKYKRVSDPWSQKLEQSWVTKTTSDGAVTGNPAEYANLVQSQEDQTEQHAATGWITEAKAVEQVEQTGIIGKIIDAEIKDFMRRLGGT